MSDTSLPKVAFFSFTSCEGCQLTVLSCEDELADMLHALNIVYFREAMTGKAEDYEIAFVEGSVSTDGEIKKLKHIRKKAKITVGLPAPQGAEFETAFPWMRWSVAYGKRLISHP